MAPQGACAHCWLLHVSPSFAQCWQVLPAKPHSFGSEPAKHTLPSQHPPQSAESHDVTGLPQAWRVASQIWKPSAVQFAHVSPRVPHALVDVPCWQVPVASQHPPGQVVALHAAASTGGWASASWPASGTTPPPSPTR